MRGWWILVLVAAWWSGPVSAQAEARKQPQAVDIEALVARNTYPFELRADGTIIGPGADLLRERTADAQFFLFGEGHNDRDTPRLAGAIYRMLHDAHGYRTVVVEQDPLAIEAASRPPLRGDVAAIAALARRYPAHFGFASDQDLGFLALAGSLGAVWGVEQAQGAPRYLEELAALAPDPAIRARVETLLERAGKESRAQPGIFMHDDPATLPALQALRQDYGTAPGSRADLLLSDLVDSARIYGYDRRAGEGEYVGLYNNTEREALFKRHFVRNYHAATTGAEPLKAMFKFGGWHMYRGKSPGQAYTIGNFAHEFAIWNGMRAYGITVLAIGGNAQWDDVPGWMRTLLPRQLPDTPVLVDLQPLKPYARPLREPVDVEDQWETRDLLQGFDAIVVLPHSAKASWDLTGFNPP